MHFLFEHRGQGGDWEAIGTGEGTWVDDALLDLRRLSSGLPPGQYRYMPESPIDATWCEIELGERGEILDLR